jgi:hypothetical protein
MSHTASIVSPVAGVNSSGFQLAADNEGAGTLGNILGTHGVKSVHHLEICLTATRPSVS